MRRYFIAAKSFWFASLKRNIPTMKQAGGNSTGLVRRDPVWVESGQSGRCEILNFRDREPGVLGPIPLLKLPALA